MSLEDDTLNRNIAASGRAATAKEELKEARALQSALAKEGVYVSRKEARGILREQKADEERQRDKMMSLVRDALPGWAKDGKGIVGEPRRVSTPQKGTPEESQSSPGTPLIIPNDAHVPSIARILGTGIINGAFGQAILYGEKQPSEAS